MKFKDFLAEVMETELVDFDRAEQLELEFEDLEAQAGEDEWLRLHAK